MSHHTSLDRQDPFVDNETGPLDFTEVFATDIIFNSHNELISWAKEKGQEVGMTIVVQRSDYNASKQKPRLVLACKMHGNKKSKKEGYSCSFLLKGVYLVEPKGKWMLKVLCGHHNHALSNTIFAPQETLKVSVNKKQKVVDKMIRKYWKLIPEFFVPYVKKIVEVDRDGNCGFIAIAKGLWSDDSRWGDIRRGCLDELNAYEVLYTQMFGGKVAIKELRQRLDCFTSPCRHKHWFLMPEMGFLVASRFDVVVVSTSGSDMSSVLPLHSWAPIGDLKVLGFQFVDNNHNVFVDIDENGPLPRPMSLWGKRKFDCALSWEARLLSRMEAYDRIKPITVEESSSIELVE